MDFRALRLEQLRNAPAGTVFTERRGCALTGIMVESGGPNRFEFRSGGQPRPDWRYQREQTLEARIAALEREPWAKG